MSTAELWGLFLTAGAAIVGWVATLYTLVGKVGALVDQVGPRGPQVRDRSTAPR